MKKTVNILVMLLLVLFLVPSCSADVTDPSSAAEPSSWEEVFLLFWNTMNTEYAHFSSGDGTDWDAVYDRYLPEFRRLDFEDRADSMKAFSLFKEIAVGIKGDSQFRLTVYDKFGSFLDITPADELKWLGNEVKTRSGASVNEYPDVWWKGTVTSLRTVGDKIVQSNVDDAPTPDEEEALKSFHSGVEGYYEIDNLNKNGYFHRSKSTLKDDFGNGYVSALISTGNESWYEVSGSRKNAGAAGIGNTKAEELWREIVEKLGIEGLSYFYGLNSDGVFYFYLSSFPSSTILEMETILSPITKPETYYALSNKMKTLYNRLWKGGAEALGKKLGTQLDQLRGICSLVNNLRLIGIMNECVLDNTTYTVNGVVMDVRGTEDGDLGFLCSLMGSFFNRETRVGYMRYRDGYSRYEYTPWTPFDVAEKYCNVLADESYGNPFYIIVNGRSKSCSETAAMMVKLLEKGKVLGGTTYGSACTVYDRSVYGSGDFSSTYVKIRTSSYEMVDLEKKSFEGTGITPDVAVTSDGKSTDIRYVEAMNAIRKDIAEE